MEGGEEGRRGGIEEHSHRRGEMVRSNSRSTKPASDHKAGMKCLVLPTSFGS